MHSLVFVGFFREVFHALTKYNVYYKLLIVEEKECNKEEPLLNIFDKVIFVEDITDSAKISHTLKKAIDTNTIKAIYANHEWAIETCGYLREQFNIFGSRQEVCKKARDKILMKKELNKKGIKTANFQLVKEHSDVRCFIQQYGLPVIVKPRKGSASVNTHIIRNYSEVASLNIPQTGLIVESFISGIEYHCDSVIFQGEVKFAAVSKYVTNCLDAVLKNEPIASIVLPDEDQALSTVVAQIQALNQQVVNALGIHTSICHLEVFITNSGECIFGEIAIRIGGKELIGNTIKAMYNIDLYDLFIFIELTSQLYLYPNKQNKFFAFIALPTKSGTITQIPTTEEYQNMDDVICAEITSHIGDLMQERNNLAIRSGYVIITGNSMEEITKRIWEIHQNFALTVEKNKLSLFSIYG